MSAQDNLNPQQFYHGTTAAFKPGDMVNPHHIIGQMGETTHMTENHSVALQYGQMKAQVQGKPSDDVHVYHVAPTGATEPDPYMASSTRSHMSFAPLKVLGEA